MIIKLLKKLRKNRNKIIKRVRNATVAIGLLVWIWLYRPEIITSSYSAVLSFLSPVIFFSFISNCLQIYRAMLSLRLMLTYFRVNPYKHKFLSAIWYATDPVFNIGLFSYPKIFNMRINGIANYLLINYGIKLTQPFLYRMSHGGDLVKKIKFRKELALDNLIDIRRIIKSILNFDGFKGYQDRSLEITNWPREIIDWKEYHDLPIKEIIKKSFDLIESYINDLLFHIN